MSLLPSRCTAVRRTRSNGIPIKSHRDPKLRVCQRGKKDLFYYFSGMTSAKGISPDGIKNGVFSLRTFRDRCHPTEKKTYLSLSPPFLPTLLTPPPPNLSRLQRGGTHRLTPPSRGKKEDETFSPYPYFLLTTSFAVLQKKRGDILHPPTS